MIKHIGILFPDKTVDAPGRRTLRQQLKSGYRANAQRDLATAAEWFPLEEKCWRTFEAAYDPKRPPEPNGRDAFAAG